MRRELSKHEFISEVLKDDFDSNKKSELMNYESIIKNPNLSSEEENKLRFNLFNKNGAFAGVINFDSEVKCFIEDFNKEKFLNLKWCPNPGEKDGVDIMTNNSRLFSDILNYLKEKKSHENGKAIKTLENYFYGELPGENKKRLFAYKINSDLYVLDGNNRSGAIILKLSREELKNFFPIEVWIIEK